MGTQITTELRTLIHEQLFPLDESFSDTSDLYAEGLDSMALMQLILLLEQHFNISFDAEDLDRDHFETLENLGKLVARKMGS